MIHQSIGLLMYGVGMLGMGIWIGIYGNELINDIKKRRRKIK